MKLDDFCYINPTEKLERNQLYDFVEMADLIPGNRYVHAKTKEIFNGSYSKFTNKDVLMAKITPCLENGKISQYIGDNKAFGSTEFNIFRAKENISDPDFLYYLISSDYVKDIAVKSMTGACGRQRANTDEIKQIEVNNIHINIQRKIAKILSNYDDLIENNNKRIKILEEMAQKIYKEWFIDFKYPGHETTIFKDTELGKIPSDWHIGCIKELNNVQGGYAFKSTDLKEVGMYGVIKIKNIQAGTVDISFCQHVDMINTKKYEKFKLSAGNLLVALTGAQVGKVGIMPYSQKIFYLNQRVGKFIPNRDFIKNNQYVLMYVSSDKFATQVNNIASGAAQPNISTSQIENIPMIVASDTIIALYEDNVDPICKEIQIIKAQNAILQETRNILLPRFMSGEINVENLMVV